MLPCRISSLAGKDLEAAKDIVSARVSTSRQSTRSDWSVDSATSESIPVFAPIPSISLSPFPSTIATGQKPFSTPCPHSQKQQHQRQLSNRIAQPSPITESARLSHHQIQLSKGCGATETPTEIYEEKEVVPISNSIQQYLKNCVRAIQKNIWKTLPTTSGRADRETAVPGKRSRRFYTAVGAGFAIVVMVSITAVVAMAVVMSNGQQRSSTDIDGPFVDDFSTTQTTMFAMSSTSPSSRISTTITLDWSDSFSRTSLTTSTSMELLPVDASRTSETSLSAGTTTSTEFDTTIAPSTSFSTSTDGPPTPIPLDPKITGSELLDPILEPITAEDPKISYIGDLHTSILGPMYNVSAASSPSKHMQPTAFLNELAALGDTAPHMATPYE